MVTPPPLPPEVRAETLRVLLALGSGAPELNPLDALELALTIGLPPRVWETRKPGMRQIGLPHLTERDVALMELASDDDLALVNECLRLEYELRERAYAAVQRLLAYANMEDGDLSERLLALRLPSFADAATCLYELGWVTPSSE